MIVFIQNTVLHYRIPFYEKLAQKEEVVVIHSGRPLSELNVKFREIVLKKYALGPFFFQRELIRTIKELSPNAVVAMFDVRWLSTIMAFYVLRAKIKWIWWGLDTGKSRVALKIKLFLALKGYPIIFYNHAILHKFVSLGLSSQYLFVANNTLSVGNRVRAYDIQNKNVFINVGSLDYRKRNELSIRALSAVRKITGRDVGLLLIGDGPARNALEKLIVDENLADAVHVIDSINDPKLLSKYYESAYASISLGQAGLAVLQSMANGVPFITSHAAISGGEKSNIIDKENGIFINQDLSELIGVMQDFVEDRINYRKLGENAYNYYTENCTLEQMVESFRKVIN